MTTSSRSLLLVCIRLDALFKNRYPWNMCPLSFLTHILQITYTKLLKHMFRFRAELSIRYSDESISLKKSNRPHCGVCEQASPSRDNSNLRTQLTQLDSCERRMNKLSRLQAMKRIICTGWDRYPDSTK